MTSSDTKVCKDCGVEKGLQEFPINKGMKDGRKNQCKSCQREFYHKNRDAELQRKKKYRERNRAKLRQKAVQYNQENREYRRQSGKQHRQNNPEQYARNAAKRNALKLQAIPEHLMDCPVEKKRLEAIYKLRQVMSLATGEEYHVDHMWPLSKGGPHWSGNLQVIPAKGNWEKSASLCENTKRVIEQSLMESTHEV